MGSEKQRSRSFHIVQQLSQGQNGTKCCGHSQVVRKTKRRCRCWDPVLPKWQLRGGQDIHRPFRRVHALPQPLSTKPALALENSSWLCWPGGPRWYLTTLFLLGSSHSQPIQDKNCNCVITTRRSFSSCFQLFFWENRNSRQGFLFAASSQRALQLDRGSNHI